MTTKFEITEVPDDLADGEYMSEIVAANWVGGDLVIKVRYAPERTQCLMPIIVNRTGEQS